MAQEPLFTIAVVHTVNFNSPAIAQAILRGFQSMAINLADMEKRIMAELQDLQLKAQQLVELNQQLLTKNGELVTQLNEGNSKTDTLIDLTGQLIITATATKDALVAARDEIARLQAASGAATAADLVALTEQLNLGITAAQSGIDAAQAGIDAANAQDLQTDAAAAAAAAAGGAVAP